MESVEVERKVGDLYGPFFTVRFFESLSSAQESAPGILTDDKKRTVAERAARTASKLGNPDTLSANDRLTDADEDKQQLFDNEKLQFYANNLRANFKGGSHGAFTLTLTPPYHEAVKLIDSRLIQMTSVVLVEWGYKGQDGTNNTSGVHIFEAQKPSINFGTNIEIILTGFDLMYSGLASKDERFVYNRKEFETDLDIIKRLAKEIDVEIDASEIGKDHLLRTKNQFPEKLEQWTSNWTFFRNILFENRVTYRTEPAEGDKGNKFKNTLILIDRDSHILSEKYKYKFVWFQQLMNDFDIPMLNFDADIMPGRAFFPGSQSITNILVDTDKGETKKVKHDDSTDDKAPKTGDNTGSGEQNRRKKAAKTPNGNTKVGGGEGAKIISSISRANSDERVRRLATDAALHANVTAEITAPGLPDLMPYDIIRVEGVGKSFAGIYIVIEVTHNLGPEGYTMNLRLVRNGGLIKLPGNVKARGAKATGKKQGSGTKDRPSDPTKHGRGVNRPRVS